MRKSHLAALLGGVFALALGLAAGRASTGGAAAGAGANLNDGVFLDFEPGFGALHHAALSEQKASPQWPYYTDLFQAHSAEVVDIVARHPAVLWDVLSTLDGWTPAVLALSDGEGDQVTISGEMINDAVGLLDGLEAHAGPALEQTIQRERAALDLPSFQGLNMNEAWETVVDRALIERQFVPMVAR